MSDYIKREDAIEALNRHKKTFSCGEDNSKERYAYMQHLADFKAIEGIPTADVVEVVRCKDCKHYKRNIPCVGGHYNGCDEWIDEGNAITVYDNDFCSYGERADA